MRAPLFVPDQVKKQARNFENRTLSVKTLRYMTFQRRKKCDTIREEG